MYNVICRPTNILVKPGDCPWQLQWSSCDRFQEIKENTSDLHQSMYLLFVIYENNCQGGPKQKFLNPQIHRNQILSIRRISKKVPDSVRFGCGFGIHHIPSTYQVFSCSFSSSLNHAGCMLPRGICAASTTICGLDDYLRVAMTTVD